MAFSDKLPTKGRTDSAGRSPESLTRDPDARGGGTPWALLRRLADGDCHSGTALGAALGVSRTAVWKAVRALEAQGIRVDAVPGRGYRLPEPLELLDPDAIRAAFPAGLEPLGLTVLPTVDSTNAWLLRAAAEGRPDPWACLAETQTAGRGRRGRDWVSPFGHNLYLSLLRRFPTGLLRLDGLALAVGVSVHRTLTRLGAQDLALKWPNDLLWHGRKLGGVLLEARGEAAGPCAVVIGIGLNLRRPTANDADWADLTTAWDGRRPPRNRLAGTLLAALLDDLDTFAEHGFAAFREDWEARDATRGRRVRVHLGDERFDAVSEGVDDAGALRVRRADGTVQPLHSGDVSLRLPEQMSPPERP